MCSPWVGGRSHLQVSIESSGLTCCRGQLSLNFLPLGLASLTEGVAASNCHGGFVHFSSRSIRLPPVDLEAPLLRHTRIYTCRRWGCVRKGEHPRERPQERPRAWFGGQGGDQRTEERRGSGPGGKPRGALASPSQVRGELRRGVRTPGGLWQTNAGRAHAPHPGIRASARPAPLECGRDL